MLRQLAVDEAARQNWVPSSEAVQASTDEFRSSRGLHGVDDFTRWLAQQHIAHEHGSALMREEVMIQWTIARLSKQALRRLPDHLRMTGQYAQLCLRANDKKRKLEEAGLLNPGLVDLGLSVEALLAWHFTRLGRTAPGDIAAYAESLGFEDESAFITAVLKDWCYVRLKKDLRD
jgi:AraC-like DNA-binding protein